MVNKINSYSIKNIPTIDKFFTKINKCYENSLTEKNIEKNKDINYFMNSNINDIDKFDIELTRLKIQLQEYKNTSVSQLAVTNNNSKNFYDASLVADIIINEYIELFKFYKNSKNIGLSLVNNNIYHWNLKFRNFDNKELKQDLQNLFLAKEYNYIEVELHFHDKLYPNYPPFIKILRPKLENNLINKISNLKMTQYDYWTPTRSVKFIINNLYSILNKHAHVSGDIAENLSDYAALESNLIKLATYIDIINTDKDIDDNKYEKFNNSTKVQESLSLTANMTTKSSYWKAGTGYGHNGSSNWKEQIT